MSKKAEIKLFVDLDDKKIPSKLSWMATDAEVDKPQDCKAFLLNLWNSDKDETLAMNLWTSSMTIPEMNEFVFQSIIQIADTYEKSTNQKDLAEKIRRNALEAWEESKKINHSKK